MGKNRFDTISEELKIIATSEIALPEHIKLRDEDLPFWDAIIESRGRTTWTAVDLIHAASLARIFCDIETISREAGDCTDEGERHKNRRVTESLIKQSISLSRFIHIHASATLGRARDTGQRTKREKELLDSQPKDGLLAKPVVQ